jgi:hypothetical protein
MSLSRWYDETPVRFLRWINRWRYGWVVIVALIAMGAGLIGLTFGWLVGESRH